MAVEPGAVLNLTAMAGEVGRDALIARVQKLRDEQQADVALINALDTLAASLQTIPNDP